MLISGLCLDEATKGVIFNGEREELGRNVYDTYVTDYGLM